MSGESFITELLKKADIKINGSRPWDIQVHDNALYLRVLTHGSLGLGEAYMDGWWDCEQLDEFIYRIRRHELQKYIHVDFAMAWSYIRGRLSNFQKTRAFEVGQRHYDIGNDLYEVMLDKRMTYSCGYWKDAQTLDDAQEAKLDLICRKISLDAGQNILDVGSGWGSFLKFAAERYGVEGLGVTVSKEQAAYANEMRHGLPIETRLQDYLTLEGKFDHVVSVGMFEHVGYKNYRTYMQKIHTLLKDDGYFLLHTIGGNKSASSGDAWSEKHIFPNGMLPSIKQIGAAVEGLFVMEDWHNFGADYDKTLLAWFKNFDAGWDSLKGSYDERFYRMWKFYLLAFAGSFRSRHFQLWQVVLSKNGTRNGYTSIR